NKAKVPAIRNSISSGWAAIAMAIFCIFIFLHFYLLQQIYPRQKRFHGISWPLLNRSKAFPYRFVSIEKRYQTAVGKDARPHLRNQACAWPVYSTLTYRSSTSRSGICCPEDFPHFQKGVYGNNRA